MPIVNPQHVLYYDPAGAMDAQSRVTVFYDSTKLWDSGGRPILWVLEGGGWLPGTGTAPDTLDTDLTTLQSRMYARGWAVAFVAYTITDVALDGDGAFDYTTWKDAGAGRLVLESVDTAKLNKRSSEKDLVNAIQYQRTTTVGDLSQLQARQAILGRSAGFITGAFVAFGPDRADPAATAGTRFSKPTRVAAFVGASSIVSWAAWLWSKSVGHLSNASGGVAATVGAGINATGAGFSGQANARYDSCLWQAIQAGADLATMRQANAQMPVWIEGAGTETYFGAYAYASMVDVLAEDHPAESVAAMEWALGTLQAEFPVGFVHATVSQFVLNWSGTTAEKITAQQELLETAIPFEALPPVVPGIIVEDGTGLPNANCYTTLAAAEEWIENCAPSTAAWDALTESAKEKKLRQATAYIDNAFGLRWKGYPKTSTQALDWPQLGVYDVLGTAIGDASVPKVLADAVAMLAAVAAVNPSLPLGGSQATSASSSAPIVRELVEVGPIKKETEYGGSGAVASSGYTSQGSVAGAVPELKQMLAPLIEAGGMGAVYRS